MAYWSRFVSALWGRTPQFPMTLGYPTVLRGGSPYEGIMYTWPKQGTRIRHVIHNGKPTNGILKFVATNRTEDGDPVFAQAEGYEHVTVTGMMFISGATSWRDTINI